MITSKASLEALAELMSWGRKICPASVSLAHLVQSGNQPFVDDSQRVLGLQELGGELGTLGLQAPGHSRLQIQLGGGGGSGGSGLRVGEPVDVGGAVHVLPGENPKVATASMI